MGFLTFTSNFGFGFFLFYYFYYFSYFIPLLFLSFFKGNGISATPYSTVLTFEKFTPSFLYPLPIQPPTFFVQLRPWKLKPETETGHNY